MKILLMSSCSQAFGVVFQDTIFQMEILILKAIFHLD